MNPFAGLRLTHAEEEGRDGLERVDFEIEQNEQQPISVGAEHGLATTTWLTLARLLPPLLGLMLNVGSRSLKRRQQIEKCLERETGEHLEHDWLSGNPSKCQHHESPQSWNVIAIIP